MPQIVVFEVYKQLRKDFFANNFDIKGMFDTSLIFFFYIYIVLGSREGFFRRGLTIACFNESVTEPV